MRDPRKNSAFDSGMRGREKPSSGGNAGERAYEGGGSPKVGNGPGEQVQGPGRQVGDAQGDGAVFSSGMRGAEKPKGPSAQAANGVNRGDIQKSATAAGEMGSPGNNTEEAALGEDHEPEGILGEEDDTHIHLRVPKASLKRKQTE